MEKTKARNSSSHPNYLHLKALKQSSLIQNELQTLSSQKPAACFYIQFPDNDFHHAIYIKERTFYELRDQISRKAQIQARRLFYQEPSSSKRLIDEEFIRQIPNGQDMAAEFLNSSDIDGDIDVILIIKV
ncbi:hypothetical protein BJX66DRAFT_318305 [Aspergillus keveii]|uniref:GRHL1/CP2 C-terminal domain-containing protein n=1 Tax=Aspergillus keveii TaxID=714993 RepID=A0ABR4FJX6_9EURO